MPIFDVAQIGLELVFVHGRSHVGSLVKSIANPETSCAVDISIDELVVNALLDDDATGGRATLASCTKRAPETAFDGKIEIRIVEHDHRILAAELKRAMLECLRGRRADDLADFRGTRE